MKQLKFKVIQVLINLIFKIAKNTEKIKNVSNNNQMVRFIKY